MVIRHVYAILAGRAMPGRQRGLGGHPKPLLIHYSFHIMDLGES